MTFYSFEKFDRKRGFGLNASFKYLSDDGKCDEMHIFLGYYPHGDVSPGSCPLFFWTLLIGWDGILGMSRNRLNSLLLYTEVCSKGKELRRQYE